MISFTSSQKKWIIIDLLYTLVSIITGIFISFYIWENNQSLNDIIVYHLAIFITIPVATTFSSLFSQMFSNTSSAVLSNAARIALLLTIIYLGSDLNDYLIEAGILSGLSIGLFAISRNSIYQMLFTGEMRSRSLGILSSGRNAIALVAPLAGAYLVSIIDSYQPLFYLSFIIVIIMSIFLITIRIQNDKTKWEVAPIKNFIFKKDYKQLLTNKFFFGIRSGVSWALFGVLVLRIFENNVKAWGIANSVIYLISILAGIFYTRYITRKFDVITIVVTSLLFATASMFLAINYGLISLLIFVLVDRVAGGFLSSSTWDLSTHILEDDEDVRHLPEYYSILEIPLAIGRVLPLIVIMLLLGELNNITVISMILMFVGFMPIFELGTLLRTNVFNNDLRYFGIEKDQYE